LQSIETSTVEIHSALALTSNYLPENPIFFSRCVFVPIMSAKKSDEQKTAFDQLKEMEEGGLGCLTLELLAHRELLEANDNYLVSFGRLYKALKAQFRGQDVGERLFANMAQIMAAPYTLMVFGKINLLLEEETTDEATIMAEFVRVGTMYINRQWRIQNESKAIAEFFEVIQSLFDQGLVMEDYHFRFEGDMVKLHFPKLYNMYQQKYRQTYFKSPADRDTIQTELTTLAGYSDWQEMQKSIRFANDGTSNSKANSIPEKRACELNYRKLQELFGVDFETRARKI
jgi:hypothetical protein